MGAAFHRHSSDQAVGTPIEFIEAVEKRYGPLTIDLAADLSNAVCERYITEKEDFFKVDLAEYIGTGFGWLNPPYSDIGPWLERCRDYGCNENVDIVVLVPASVGSNWWKNYVHNNGAVVFLNSRIKFVGHKHPYPKDLALIFYGPKSDHMQNYSIWDWKKEIE